MIASPSSSVLAVVTLHVRSSPSSAASGVISTPGPVFGNTTIPTFATATAPSGSRTSRRISASALGAKVSQAVVPSPAGSAVAQTSASPTNQVTDSSAIPSFGSLTAPRSDNAVPASTAAPSDGVVIVATGSLLNFVREGSGPQASSSSGRATKARMGSSGGRRFDHEDYVCGGLAHSGPASQLGFPSQRHYARPQRGGHEHSAVHHPVQHRSYRGEMSPLLRREEDAEGADDGDSTFNRDRPGLSIVDEQDRAQRHRERDRRGLPDVEPTEEPGVRLLRHHTDPIGSRHLIAAHQSRAGHSHLVVDDARHDHVYVERMQKLYFSGTREVDERACVGDDDHPEPKVPSSRSRSSAR